jgi:uncharacterized protein YkwD
MRARRPVVVAATLVALLLVASQPADASRAVEREFAQMVNDTRAVALKSSLQVNEQLVRRARRHSKQMARRGELFHSNLDPLLGNGRRSVGENVAYAGSLDSALDAFLDSPPHLANILGDFDETGVGIMRRDGVYWITQIFAA